MRQKRPADGQKKKKIANHKKTKSIGDILKNDAAVQIDVCIIFRNVMECTCYDGFVDKHHDPTANGPCRYDMNPTA